MSPRSRSRAGSPPQVNHPVAENALIPMRDGTLLAADIHHPRGESGPLPALLQRTPYNKAAAPSIESQFLFLKQRHSPKTVALSPNLL